MLRRVIHLTHSEHTLSEIPEFHTGALLEQRTLSFKGSAVASAAAAAALSLSRTSFCCRLGDPSGTSERASERVRQHTERQSRLSKKFIVCATSKTSHAWLYTYTYVYKQEARARA